MPLSSPQLYEHLRLLANALGIEVREEPLDESPGGLYRLKGKKHLLINQKLPMEAKTDLMVEILKTEDLSGLYLLPALREALEH